MIIGSVVFDIYIPYSHSLKSKRMVIKSFKEKLRSKFNVSVAEIGGQDKWQTAQIAVVMVGQEQNQVEKSIQNIVNFVEANYPDIHINVFKEII